MSTPHGFQGVVDIIAWLVNITNDNYTSEMKFLLLYLSLFQLKEAIQLALEKRAAAFPLLDLNTFQVTSRRRRSDCKFGSVLLSIFLIFQFFPYLSLLCF